MCLFFGNKFFDLSCGWIASSFFDEFATFGDTVVLSVSYECFDSEYVEVLTCRRRYPL